MKIKPFLPMAAIFWSSLAIAASPMADLLHLHRLALKNDATLAAAAAEHASEMEALPQARSQFRPSIAVSVSAMRNHLDNHTSIAGRPVDRDYDFTSQRYALTLTQPLWRKQLHAQYDQAEAQVRYADARFTAAELELTLKLSQAYFDALLAENNVELAAEQKNAISEQLRMAQRLYESGFGTVTDVNEARARLDSVEAEEIAARNHLEIRRRSLEEFTGELPEQLAPLAQDIPLAQPEPALPEPWIEHAMSRNPAIQSREAAVEITRQEIEKSRSGHYPSIDLIARLNRETDPGYTTLDTRNHNAELGVQLQFPLYQGGYVDSRVRQARASHERARSELDATRRGLAKQTRQEYLNVVNGVAQVKALEQALRSHQIALDSMKKGFRAGVRTSVDILNEQRLLFTAKRDLLQARYDYILSRMKLKASAGMLDQSEMTLVNSWLVRAPDTAATP